MGIGFQKHFSHELTRMFMDYASGNAGRISPGTTFWRA